MKKILNALLVVSVVLSVCTAAYAGPYTGGAVKAKFASEEIEGDFMTVWARKFSEHMKEWSDGKIEIEVYPYGTIGASGDINELAQLGVVQFVFSDYAWISAFVPQVQVFTLNYLFPTQKAPEVLDWMMEKGEAMPLLETHFRNAGLVPMGILYEGWQWITSKTPIKSLKDVQGMKTRVMASKLLVEDYKAYGMTPTPMDYGEVYSGLQMGLIDAQVNPIFADYSMKFYEVQDYFTQARNEPFLGIPTANQEFFNSLTPEAQQEMVSFWKKAIIEAGKWIDAKNAADLEKIRKARPEVVFSTLDNEAIAEFKARAKTVYPKFVELGGDGAQEVLDAVLRDIDGAKKDLGIKQ